MEKLEEQEKSIELGLTNPVEIIEDQRGVDEDEAKDIYDENITIRNKNNEKLNKPTLNENQTAIDMGIVPE